MGLYVAALDVTEDKVALAWTLNQVNRVFADLKAGRVDGRLVITF
jgi:D-arabinose 1-dehydrogenase-like Zn-dependent alcohol dehydrogenase